MFSTYQLRQLYRYVYSHNTHNSHRRIHFLQYLVEHYVPGQDKHFYQSIRSRFLITIRVNWTIKPTFKQLLSIYWLHRWVAQLNADWQLDCSIRLIKQNPIMSKYLMEFIFLVFKFKISMMSKDANYPTVVRRTFSIENWF